MIEREILKRILNNPQILRSVGFNDHEIQQGVNPMNLETDDPRRAALLQILEMEMQRPEIQAMMVQQGSPQMVQDPQGMPQQAPVSPPMQSAMPMDVPGMPITPQMQPQMPQVPQGEAAQTVFNKNQSGSNIAGAGKLLESEIFKPRSRSDYTSSFKLGQGGGNYEYGKGGNGLLGHAQSLRSNLFQSTPQQTPAPQQSTPLPTPEQAVQNSSLLQKAGNFLKKGADFVKGISPHPFPQYANLQNIIQGARQARESDYQLPQAVSLPPKYPNPFMAINAPLGVSAEISKLLGKEALDYIHQKAFDREYPIFSSDSPLENPSQMTPIPQAGQSQEGGALATPQQVTEEGADGLVNDQEDSLLNQYFNAYAGAENYADAALREEGVTYPWDRLKEIESELREGYELDKLKKQVLDQGYLFETLPEALEQRINEKDQVMSTIEAQQDAIYDELFRMQDNPDPANIGRRKYLSKKLASLSRVRGQQVQSYDRLVNSITNAAQADYNKALQNYQLSYAEYENALNREYKSYQEYFEYTKGLKESTYNALEKAREALQTQNTVNGMTKAEQIKHMMQILGRGDQPIQDEAGNLLGYSKFKDGVKVGDFYFPGAVESQVNTGEFTGAAVWEPVNFQGRNYADAKRALDTGEQYGDAKSEGGARWYAPDPGIKWFIEQMKWWDENREENGDYAEYTDAAAQGTILGPDGTLIIENNSIAKINELIDSGETDYNRIKNILQNTGGSGWLDSPWNKGLWDGSAEWYLDTILGGGIVRPQEAPMPTAQDLPPQPSGNNFSAFVSPTGSGVVTGYGSAYSAEGLDIAYKDGIIPAPVSGVITKVINAFRNNTGKPLPKEQGKQQNGGWGNQVVMKLDDGRELRLSHFANIFPTVQVGQRVKAGEPLGPQGNTGLTYGRTGVHTDIASPGLNPYQVAQLIRIAAPDSQYAKENRLA